ncbi:MAG: hypothetical protein COT16_02530 [Elusimicrobia bacterium CG08_land_8_20_14_0_20_44_26]|nr:MAG: hypothetical protein COT16_02530 [Elusimicrobia bacterium CG08_land_8_20_14_0_20_44_26]
MALPALKILVIEDDPDAAAITRDRLIKADYRVISAFNAEQGIEYAKSLSPDIILLDINLPDGSGEMVYSALFAMSETKNVPVIIVSGVEPERIRKMHQLKVIDSRDIFLKPFDFDELLKRIAFKLKVKIQRSNKKILIADDDTSVNEIVRKKLEDYGFAAMSVFGGYEAIEAAKKEKPDLILLDINLPAGSGGLAYGVMRALKETRNIPIIIISGEDPATVRRMHLQKNIEREDIFLKPLNFKKLFERINFYLFPE